MVLHVFLLQVRTNAWSSFVSGMCSLWYPALKILKEGLVWGEWMICIRIYKETETRL